MAAPDESGGGPPDIAVARAPLEPIAGLIPSARRAGNRGGPPDPAATEAHPEPIAILVPSAWQLDPVL